MSRPVALNPRYAGESTDLTVTLGVDAVAAFSSSSGLAPYSSTIDAARQQIVAGQECQPTSLRPL